MRKNATKIAALALSLALTVTSVNIPTNASAATVKLNQKKATLYVSGAKTKKTTTLKVTGTTKKVTFTSNKKSVATVKSTGKVTAKVTAKKAGKATITAKVGKKSYKCTITVKKKYTPVTSLTVSPKTVSLKVGETKTIKATVKPAKPTEKGVTYESNKKSVATVSSKGKITAKKAGSAKITVTTKGATKTASNKKATVAVTVTKATTATPSTNPSDTPSTNPSDTPTDAPTETPSAVPTELAEMTDAVVKAADTIVATFAADVPADTEITVATKDGTAVESASVTKEGATATFVSKAKFPVGTYTITAKLGETSFSKEVVVEAEKVAEIKVTSTQALLKPGDKYTAYVYYDVYNQYGDSMRSSTSVTWTSSIGQAKANKSTGCITITTTGSEFRYGDKLYLVGVDSKNGITCQAEVSVGLERMIGDVEFAGFLNKKGDTTKIEKELPANFPKDTYVLLYTTKDQDGQVIDAVDNNIAGTTVSGAAMGANLTFTSNNPMVVKGDIKDDAVYTVDGVEYCSAKMEPGQYADRGGEVEIMVISTKSGAQKKINFTVGAAARLQSFTIQQPTGTVADGDKGVVIPFEAKDTNGNIIKNYETIVRSTNELVLNSGSNGYFGIAENDDGTARLWWDDAKATTPSHDSWSYSDSTAFDGVDRSVSLTATVIGGEGSNILFSVSDMRRPTTIKKVKINDDDADALVNEATATFSIKDEGKVTYLDQYGESRWRGDNGVNPSTFFWKAAGNDGGLANNHYYGVKVDIAENAQTHLNLDADKIYLGDNDKCNVTFTGKNTGGAEGKDVKTDNVKYSVVESESKTAGASDWSEVGKALSASYAVVPMKALSGLSVKAIGRQQLVTSNSDADNGFGITAASSGAVTMDAQAGGARNIVNGATAVVTGTYGAKTLTVPKEYCVVTGGVFTVDEDNKLIGMEDITWKELYDVNSAKNTRIDATKSLSVAVYTSTTTQNADTLFGTPKTNVKISDGKSVPTEIAFTQWKSDKLTSANLEPYNTDLKNTGDNGLFVYVAGKLKEIDKHLAVTVFDQYGNAMPYGSNKASGQVEVEFAVSDIVENNDEFAHLPNSFSVSKNNSFDIAITGAEIKDKFNLTATVVGDPSVTTKISVTVKSDNQATMGTTWTQTDEIFRTSKLGYER